MADILRDVELEQRMLQAVIDDRNSQPRNQQLLVGPSSIGFCRELLRASLFEQNLSAAVQQETHWAAAAHIGSALGAEFEAIFGRRLGALEQQRITTYLERIGVSISGALDLVFMGENQVSDLKSTTDIGGLMYDLKKNATGIETLLSIWREGRLFDHSVETPDGGYELTQAVLNDFSKLQYYVQIAIYVVGAMQAGILSEGATGRLVFYDRAGDFQEFVALVVTAEEIALFYEIGQHRVEQVAYAQEAFERGGGNPAIIAHLRDQPPSFCFSTKVLCPLRERCWGGSTWDPEQMLDSPEVSASVNRYIEGRRLKKLGDGMTKAAREELKGIEGRFADGRMVSWTGATKSTINVVETAERSAIPTPKTPGERVAAAAAAQDLTIPPEVGITKAGEVVDVSERERPADQAASIERLRELQQLVAQGSSERAAVCARVAAELESEERSRYGGMTLFEHLEYERVEPAKARAIRAQRASTLIDLQRQALVEAGLRVE